MKVSKKNNHFWEYYLKSLAKLGLILLFIMSLHFMVFNPYANTGLRSDALFYTWNWFHLIFIIPLLWWIMPPISIIVLIQILQDNGKIPYLIPSRYSKKIPRLFYEVFFLCLIVLNLGAISQALGGCVWQIPNFIYHPNYYHWKRFGYELMPAPALAFFYFLTFIISSWSLILLRKKYLS